MPWVRLWDDMPTDPKWRVVAIRSKRSLPEIIAVWSFMLVRAGQTDGSIEGWADDDVAAALDMEPGHVKAIREAMQGKVLNGNNLSGWDRRQPKREDPSAERTRDYRRRLKAKRIVTHGDAHVTQRDAPDTEADTDTDKNPLVVPPRGDPPEKGPKMRKGTRLPDDWQATQDHRRVARSKGIGYAETELEVGGFKTYYTVGPGRNKTFSDWDRAWANWCDKAVSFGGGRPAPVNGQRHNGGAPPRKLTPVTKDTPRHELRYPDKPWYDDDNVPDYAEMRRLGLMPEANGTDDDGPW